jgi:hypothetical protein
MGYATGYACLTKPIILCGPKRSPDIHPLCDGRNPADANLVWFLRLHSHREPTIRSASKNIWWVKIWFLLTNHNSGKNANSFFGENQTENLVNIKNRLARMEVYLGALCTAETLCSTKESRGWSKQESKDTYLTGLLVRETRRDSRQMSSLSSVMPERSSWTYSCDDNVHSCLLFLSPPWRENAQQKNVIIIVLKR